MKSRFEVPQGKIPASGGRTFLQIGEQSIALFNIENQLYAINDSCPHQGASLFSGKLHGCMIQCCAHGLRFNLADGCMVNSTLLKVDTYAVEQVGEQVCIVLDSGAKHE